MVSGEKRNCEGENFLEKATAILLDVEGTTTSISFVKETLFPYIRENLKAYIDSHWNDDEFKEDLKALKQQAKKDEEDKVENFCPIEEKEKEKDSLLKNVFWQMDLDRKTTALKQLQGHIWREGYENGKLKGQVYEDVPPMLKKWCEDGRKLYIYSSGSAEAQKLLFKNSEAGDLETYLTGHFDTEIGPKTDASSYTNIAKAVGIDCSQILFLTDSVKEAVAADKAGLQVTIVVREGNAPLTDDEKKAFTTITSFKELVFESSSKKKKICEEGQELEKSENVEKVEETEEIKNGEAEKMEVESSEEKPDTNRSVESEAEKNYESKPEHDEVPNSEEKNEAEVSDAVVTDYRELKGESEATDKVVTSSIEDAGEIKTEETSSNGKVEESEKETVDEEMKECSDKTVDSTDETAPMVTESNADGEIESSTQEENPANESGEKSNKEEKEWNEESNSVNGLEKNEAEESGQETREDVNGSEANGKLDENVSEPVPLKKVAPEEQADSTVEVTA